MCNQFKVFASISIMFFSFSLFSLVENINSADALYGKRSDNNKNAFEAYKIYKQLLEKGENSPDLKSKIAMANYFVGLHYETMFSEEKKDLESKKEKHFKEGIEIANKCIADLGAYKSEMGAKNMLSEKSQKLLGECYFWLSCNQALLSDLRGPLRLLVSLSDVIDNLIVVSKINPEYAGAGAYRILGAIYQKMPGIIGGNNKKAEDFFQKAIAQSPREPLNYLFISKYYFQNKNLEEALRYAKIGASLPKPESKFYESVGAIDELKAFVGNKKY